MTAATHTNNKTGKPVVVLDTYVSITGEMAVMFVAVKDGVRFGPSRSMFVTKFNAAYRPVEPT